MPASKTTPDRRIARTRGALRGALIELILEKGYDAIAVNDIVTRANVARSTFYAHHGSKESVLLDGIGMLREFLTKAQRDARAGATGSIDPLGFMLAFFEHADGHRELYHVLMSGDGGAVLIKALRQMFDRLIRRGLIEAAESGREPAVPVEATTRFTTDALMAVMTWWVDAKPRLSAEDGHRIARQLIDPSLIKNGFYEG